MSRFKAILLCCCFLSTQAVGAESVFVIDKLLVGIHKESDLNSAIIKVLPTGSQLQVLERKAQTARIRDAEGTEGWVDAAYLMKDVPAAFQVSELRQERMMLLERVKQMEAKLAAGEGANGQDDAVRVDKLTNENTELKSQLSSLKLKGSELEQQAKSRPEGASDGTVAGELRKANREFTKTVEQLRQRNAELESRGPGIPGENGGFARHVSVWSVLGGLLLAGLCFGGGLYFADYQGRRRHGGFRI